MLHFCSCLCTVREHLSLCLSVTSPMLRRAGLSGGVWNAAASRVGTCSTERDATATLCSPCVSITQQAHSCNHQLEVDARAWLFLNDTSELLLPDASASSHVPAARVASLPQPPRRLDPSIIPRTLTHSHSVTTHHLVATTTSGTVPIRSRLGDKRSGRPVNSRVGALRHPV